MDALFPQNSSVATEATECKSQIWKETWQNCTLQIVQKKISVN